MENENGKIGEMEKKGMEKCGWTAGDEGYWYYDGIEIEWIGNEGRRVR